MEFLMRPGSFTVLLLAAGLGIHATASARAVEPAAACDAMASHRYDRDRPEGTAGTTTIAKPRAAKP